MAEDLPWREITPDDYQSECRSLARSRQAALLVEMGRGEFRWRLLLCESHHLKNRPNCDPYYVHDYNYRPYIFVRKMDEIVIVLVDGNKYVLDRNKHPWVIIPVDLEERSANCIAAVTDLR